jgi:hypothetical protein
MNSRLPRLDKLEAPLTTPEEHARDLERACRAAAQILGATPERPGRDLQAPMPPSTIRLLRRLPRRRD